MSGLTPEAKNQKSGIKKNGNYRGSSPIYRKFQVYEVHTLKIKYS